MVVIKRLVVEESLNLSQVIRGLFRVYVLTMITVMGIPPPVDMMVLAVFVKIAKCLRKLCITQYSAYRGGAVSRYAT